MTREEEIIDKLKVYYGIPPFDSTVNLCFLDTYYLRHIGNMYSLAEIEAGKKFIRANYELEDM